MGLNPAQVPHLIPEQMQWLPLNLVEYLNQPAQIFRRGEQYRLRNM